jgi:hypothetical protein
MSKTIAKQLDWCQLRLAIEIFWMVLREMIPPRCSCCARGLRRRLGGAADGNEHLLLPNGGRLKSSAHQHGPKFAVL